MNVSYFFRFAYFGLVSISTLVVGLPLCYSEESGMTERERKREETSQRYNRYFGNVDFTEGWLGKRVHFIQPKPEEIFTPFDREVLAAYVKGNHSYWLKELFKGALLEAFSGLEPTGFYLNQTGTNEPSLLLYKANIEDTQFTIQESCRVMLLTVKEKEIDYSKGVEGGEISRILGEWINLEGTNSNVIGYFKELGRDVDPAFVAVPDWDTDLSGRLEVGTVFSNCDRDMEMIREPYWRSEIVGIVSERGICFLLFKTDGIQGAMVGFPSDYNWLNEGLYKPDGVTFLDDRVSANDVRRPKPLMPMTNARRDELFERATNALFNLKEKVPVP